LAIIVSKKGVAPATLVAKSRFEKEVDLQEYIHQHPEVIPIYDIREDKRLFVAAREFATASGPIDALAIDKDGDIYVIETKLYANADKRRVVAQALDYGASLWKHFSEFTEFVSLLDTHAHSHWSMGFQQKATEYFSLDDIGAELMLTRMRDNLRAGNLKFVVLMDSINEPLKELIAYVNMKSQFDIYAVELELYEYEDYRIVLPKLYGAGTKKDSAPPSPRPAMTEQQLLKYIEANDPTCAQWAETLFARFRAVGLTPRGLGSTITYGVDMNDDFVPLLDFQARCVYAGLRIGTIRALTGEQFVRCKKMMNTLGPFYGVSEVDDPTKSVSKGPGYEKVSNDVELFISTVKSVADVVRSAFATDRTV
jgi:hypothetical protein